MKKLLTIVILLNLCSFNYPQKFPFDSIPLSDSVWNFFPSELNNKYQAKIFSEGVGPGGGGYQSSTSYRSYTIIADTIINGKRFVRFNDYYPFTSTNYFYYDQIDQKLFIKIPSDDSIRLAVDFNLPAGDTIISYISGTPLPFVSAGMANVYLFGDSVMTYKLDYNIIEKKYSYTFANNIGLSRYYALSRFGITFWGASTLTLFSAIVDTVSYNPIYLNITSISPLINRPVNSFPFVMTGSYQTNLDLVDTFFVEIFHLRGVDTLHRFSYPFINNRFTFYLASMAGDRLLVKAHIRDHSIFNNYDTYPDSGYAEILVLPSTVDVEDNFKVYSFRLEQNYPNPFNPTTNISYSIPERLPVSVSVYDAIGNEIIIAVNEVQDKGEYTCTIDCSGLSSGIYIYKINAGAYTDARKMVLVR